jgi:hypothetical protein
MGLGWLGTFRQGQWRSYRSFVLNERRDVGRRMAVIEAELTRIGEVSVSYAITKGDTPEETTVTEQRTGFRVTQGSSLEKLIQAYIAQGGNPFDVSLFLSPDSTFLTDADDDDSESPTQPYGGVIYPKSGNYSVGTRYEGGFLVVRKYPPSRTGGRKDLQDNTVAGAVDTSRRWVNQTIQTRIHDIEARIIKLCDLREQLRQELDALTMAVGGTTGAVPTLDQEFFSEDLGVAKIIAAIDSVFYEQNSDGVPDFATINKTAMADYPSIMSDVEGGEEDNTAL